MAGFFAARESDERQAAQGDVHYLQAGPEVWTHSSQRSSNPLRWVEQSAKSYYKPIVVDPDTAAKIFEALSGMELALAILVAATGFVSVKLRAEVG